MMFKTIFLRLTSLCVVLPAFAGEMGHTSPDYFISMSAGPNWTSLGSSQTIALEPDVINTYVSENNSHTNLLVNGEIFLGVQKQFFQRIHSQFGVAFYISNPAELNGDIQIDGNPNFQNYTYQYQINHEHIAFKSKWIFEQSLNINPYVSGSVGVGFNRSYGYSSTPLIFPSVSLPSFQSNTQVALSYSGGVGFERALNKNLTIALGYQLVSWGASHLGPLSGQTSNQGLSLNNIYTQGLEFNINYLL